MKKKTKIKRMKRVIDKMYALNGELIKENVTLVKRNEEAMRLYKSLLSLSKRHTERNATLIEEVKRQKLELDVCRAQLQDVQEKMRKFVFVPIK